MSVRIRLGMVGGGAGSFIGPVHRIASRIDDRFELVAGALASNEEGALVSGRAIGLAEDRIYADFRHMAAEEAKRSDGIEAVVIATPNHLHMEPCRHFLEKGIHVICDKPVTSTLEDALELEKIIATSGCKFLLTHNYSGYPMVREARRLVQSGALGDIRLINMEYIQAWLAGEVCNKQAEWRLDPERSGRGGCVADIGTHAYHLGCYVTGSRAGELSADLHTFGEGRQLDDNAHIKLRFENGAKGLLWASQVAIGYENGIRLRVVGDKAGLEFFQEDPNKLWFTRVGEAKQMLTTGGPGFEGTIRVPAGHPEGFFEAFANLYDGFADILQGKKDDPAGLPGIESGIEGLKFITAAVNSSQANGAWQALRE